MRRVGFWLTGVYATQKVKRDQCPEIVRTCLRGGQHLGFALRQKISGPFISRVALAPMCSTLGFQLVPR